MHLLLLTPLPIFRSWDFTSTEPPRSQTSEDECIHHGYPHLHPDHKALTNTTHDGSTKAPALQSLYSLDQDTLNSRVSDRNNNKTDDRAAKARAPTFLCIQNPTTVLCSLPIATMACHHSNAPSSCYLKTNMGRLPVHPALEPLSVCLQYCNKINKNQIKDMNTI